MNDKLARMDMGIFMASLALLGVGIVLVYSSSFAVAQDKFGVSDFFLERQVFRAVLAFVCFIVMINIDYHVWDSLSSLGFMIALGMLVVVLMLPESHAINGAKRWFGIGPVRFQVSEFARIALIVMLASRLGAIREEIREFKRFGLCIAKIALICMLIVLEPDFSTALIIGLVGLAIVFVAGARFWHVAALLLAILPATGMAVLLTPYRRQRLIGFFRMSDHRETISYQAYQSIIGLGHGGIFGVGLGQGNQKYFYLPEPHTDFVFSILGEEIGFVGLIAVLGIFGFIIYRGMRIALSAPDRSGRLMAFGITLTLAAYMLLHTCVNTGLVPTTGVPLPFLSYGGMSLIFTMISMGILLNISSQSTRPLQPQPVRLKVKGRRKKRRPRTG